MGFLGCYLKVREVGDVGFGDVAVFADDGIELGLELAAAVGVAEELGDGPLDGIGGRVGAGEEHVLDDAVDGVVVQAAGGRFVLLRQEQVHEVLAHGGVAGLLYVQKPLRELVHVRLHLAHEAWVAEQVRCPLEPRQEVAHHHDRRYVEQLEN